MGDLGDSTARTGPALQEGEEATLPRAHPVDAPVPLSVGRLPTADEAPDLAASVTQSSELALRRQDAARARGFARLVIVLCSAGLVSQYFLGGVPWLRIAFGVALVALGAVALRTWWVARSPIDYAPPVARVFGSVAVGTSLIVAWYLGVLSPAPMLVVLGVSFFAMSDDRVTAFGVPALAAGGYALLSALIAGGILPDEGLMPALSVDATPRFAAVLLVPVVMGLAVWQARVTRRATLDALDRAVAAMREMRTREAQLEEANRDLDFLMRMAAGRAGPYTGLMAGKYAIRHLIARGAMGEVYAATDTDGGGDAAIKLLQSGMLRDEQLVARFLREGEAVSKLEGPNVVAIYEVGTIGANGAPYIAMELLRGHDLGWHLRQRGALPLDEVVALADQVARALEAARKAGIVHRDLKPQNLFYAQQNAAAPLWKILDFGVSRLAGSSGTLTMDLIVGTPGYMSPEQAAGGKEVTHRSDIFSFGAVLYRALTGQPPFSGPDTPQILYQVVYRSPARPSQLVPGLPADVEIVLAIALAKDPSERFASALEMAEALRAAAKGTLDPSFRVHAQTLLAALPWGHSSYDESEVEIIEVSTGH
ncbi:MAG TPA: serine/threonine-protein kinase [Polyangiaceae bacterium]